MSFGAASSVAWLGPVFSDDSRGSQRGACTLQDGGAEVMTCRWVEMLCQTQTSFTEERGEKKIAKSHACR